jgi:hypothetical protein
MNDKYVDFSKVQEAKPMTSNRQLARDIATAWETFSKEQLKACQGWLREALNDGICHTSTATIQSNKIQAYRNCLQGAENIMAKMLRDIAACRDAVTYRDYVSAFQSWQEEKEGL